MSKKSLRVTKTGGGVKVMVRESDVAKLMLAKLIMY